MSAIKLMASYRNDGGLAVYTIPRMNNFTFGNERFGYYETIGGGAGAGKVDITSLTLHKQVDMSSVKLFTNCCKGTHFDNAVMTVREAGGDAPLEYYVINLKQVFIDNMHWDGSTGAGKPTESVSISFAEFKITYRQQSKTGGEDKKDELGWNLKTNAAAA